MRHGPRSVLLMVGCAATQIAFGQTRYDAAADFSPVKNPGGAWSYGWMPAGSEDFTLYANARTPFGFPEWTGDFSPDPGHPTTQPNVLVNNTESAFKVSDTDFQPHRVTCHPGPNNERSVVRWTSPYSGPIQLSAAFEGRAATTTTDVSVYHHGSLVFFGAVTGYDVFSRISLSTNLTMMAGDSLDFVVSYGSNGNYSSDTTQVDATIIFGPRVSIRVSPFEICWDSVSNRLYQVEYKPVLTTNTWTPLTTNILAGGYRTCVSDSASEAQVQRFYRVVLLPE
jgi:hypothetical protein